jgi:AcrR family transcriptional regulator
MMELHSTGKDEVREALINSARVVFARFGFKKTSLDDISRESRRGKSTIYYYFKSKDEIFKAVIDSEAEILRKSINEAIALVDDPAERLKRYIFLRMSLIRKVANYYEILKNEMLDNLPFVSHRKAAHLENEINHMEEMLQDGIDKNQFAIKNPRLTAQTIVAALQGFEVPLITGNLTDEEIRQSVDEMMNILFYGILVKD